jgi:hypothetical protein
VSRDWFAVYSRLLRLPKFRRLSHDAQLGLFYVWALAGDETPEATWPTIDHLAVLLEFYGHARSVGEELASGGFLDVNDFGNVSVHDWDDHQLAATVSARRKWEAVYMRKWRRERKASATEQAPLPAPSPEQSNTGQIDRTEPPTPRPRVSNGAREDPPERTTCPGCGDLVVDGEANVAVVDRRGWLGHLQCPALAA